MYPFKALLDPQLAAPVDQDGARNRETEADSPDNVIHFRPAEISPLAQYLDFNVDLQTLPIPYARFPGTKMVLPDCEAVCSGWSDFINEIAPDPVPTIEHKEHVPYFVAGTLREAELINVRLREQRLSSGQSTVGKQRSSAHIDTLGPAVLLDDDGDVFTREPALRAMAVAAAIYTSHSYGFPKGPGEPDARGGRVVLVLNRTVTASEYGLVWDAINHLLGGCFDEHGRSPALCYGRHARRNDQAPYRRLIIDGAAVNADALIELGRSLRPEPAHVVSERSTAGGRKRVPGEEVERARLMGSVRPPDVYNEWMSGAAAFKRTFPDDMEAAFQCFDVWSECSAKYNGTEATRRKFEEVPADYDGGAVPVTLGMLHWRVRRRAEAVIAGLYSPSLQWQKPAAFAGVTAESLGAGIPRPKGAEPIPPDTLNPEDGVVALEYLHYCWSEEVFQQIVAAQAIQQSVLDEVRQRSDRRREKIDLAGRTLYTWDGKNLATDTAALAQAIITAKPKLYRVDHALVRISPPVSDPATAERVRVSHGYTGAPGEPGDPVLHAGERLIPILPSDAEALREIIGEHVATKRRVNKGTTEKSDYQEVVVSFGFKASVHIQNEPDAGVLKDLLKRGLIMHVPEILGIITAPVMPDLPASTDPGDLLKTGVDRLITSSGLDAASGLYLSPLGTVVDVPDSPSEAHVRRATDHLREPWQDFPFASPGGEISRDVSRSAALYATIIAANRRALEIAPGVAFSSHGEGMSSGKTLAGEVIGIVATGERPAPASLSPDFSEQRKELVAYLVEGNGVLFLANIPGGSRFDSASLAAVMTNSRYKGRLLGASKEIKVGTQTMVVAATR